MKAIPLAFACLLACGVAGAQAPDGAGAALSSPLGSGGLPPGSGAGYHSPQSPIKPLPTRSDVVPWSTLTNLQKKTLKTRIEPVFNPEQKALNQTVQRVQGVRPVLPHGRGQARPVTPTPRPTC